MDDADRATDRQAFEDELAKTNRENKVTESSENCLICEIYISQARQEATGGISHCVDCAEYLERE